MLKNKYTITFLICLLSIAAFWTLFIKKPTPQVTLGITQEETKRPLPIQGTIPEWLQGTFVRNSAIPFCKDGKQISHEFDGLAMLHGFVIKQGKIAYTSRYLRSEEYDALVNQGAESIQGFAQASAKKKSKSKNQVKNASVNIYKYNTSYVALTEVPPPVKFNLHTMETTGNFTFQDDLPKEHVWESAHPHYDFEKKELVNYLIEFGPQSYYVLYRMKEGSSSREVIAKIPVDMPAYMHSFAMTEQYLILTEFPLLVRPLDLMTSGKPFIHNFQWLPERGTRFLVVDRKSGKLVSQSTTEAIFSYHHANAYEEGNELIIDLIAYPDISANAGIFPQAKELDTSKKTWERRLVRYFVSLKTNEILPAVLLEEELEFPRFNERLDGKPYRYLYMTCAQDNRTKGITKFDLTLNSLDTWQEDNYKTVEPVFVPSPFATSEDDGVLLTIISNAEQKASYLLVLDAKTLTEIARAKLPCIIPGSFHGQYFSDSLFVPAS